MKQKIEGGNWYNKPVHLKSSQVKKGIKYE